ncbi:hypothetical protein AVDCRST_MAG92-617 [uncultured Coleofasciculus sp.]|uniref:Uncharacterized protein n=1 Tax=uncultured Coleofasciculus sp. TaxID=1267456 RepID=A0A6J4HEC9_9CYAN|nr:hypothetical protein AVDCRST_MAG92-617 [uncultured Coleofasciculus sp.]
MALIRESGNDYLIGLKQNQPTLCKTAEIQQHTSPPLSQATVVDNTHEASESSAMFRCSRLHQSCNGNGLDSLAS